MSSKIYYNDVELENLLAPPHFIPSSGKYQIMNIKTLNDYNISADDSFKFLCQSPLWDKWGGGTLDLPFYYKADGETTYSKIPFLGQNYLSMPIIPPRELDVVKYTYSGYGKHNIIAITIGGSDNNWGNPTRVNFTVKETGQSIELKGDLATSTLYKNPVTLNLSDNPIFMIEMLGGGGSGSAGTNATGGGGGAYVSFPLDLKAFYNLITDNNTVNNTPGTELFYLQVGPGGAAGNGHSGTASVLKSDKTNITYVSAGGGQGGQTSGTAKGGTINIEKSIEESFYNNVTCNKAYIVEINGGNGTNTYDSVNSNIPGITGGYYNKYFGNGEYIPNNAKYGRGYSGTSYWSGGGSALGGYPINTNTASGSGFGYGGIGRKSTSNYGYGGSPGVIVIHYFTYK